MSFSGTLEMGTAYLPVNQNWFHFIDKCEQTCADMERELVERVDQLADEAWKRLANGQL